MLRIVKVAAAVLLLLGGGAGPAKLWAQVDQRLRNTSGDRWFAGAYEVTCDEIANREGTLTFTVYGIARNERDALLEARRNAVRAVMFRGVECGGREPAMLRLEMMTPHVDSLLQRFFAQGGPYLGYVTVVEEIADRISAGRDVKIGSLVRVDKSRLRQDLELQGIIRSLAGGFENP